MKIEDLEAFELSQMKVITEKLTELSVIHPESIEVNDATVMVWFNALKQFGNDDLEKGFNKVMGDIERFPKPFHVKHAIESISFGDFPSPEEAWSEVLSTCSNLTWGSPAPEYSHPLIGEAVKGIGGCSKIIECETREIGFLRHSFLSVYKTTVQSHKASMIQDKKIQLLSLGGKSG